MKKLRYLHLYLGCIFAPMLLFFAISGIWQTLGLGHSGLLAELSTAHTGAALKSGITLNSRILRGFVVLMAAGFIISTLLGVVMALTQGGNRRTALWCLLLGTLFPAAVMGFSAFTSRGIRRDRTLRPWLGNDVAVYAGGESLKFPWTLSLNGTFSTTTGYDLVPLRGTWFVKDGTLVMVYTNAPGVKNYGAEPMERVERFRMIHVDEHQLVYEIGGETNVMSRSEPATGP